MKPMRKFGAPTPQSTRPYIGYLIVTLMYIVLNLVLPGNRGTMNTYHLTASEYHILLFLINIPIAAIWFVAFYGYKLLQDYSRMIDTSAEGPNFHRISRGLAWLAWGPPLTSIISSLLYAFAYHSMHRYYFALVLNHYLSVLIPVVAFSLIQGGTHRLTFDQFRPSAQHLRWVFAIFTLFGVSFSFYSFNQITPASSNPFHLNPWLTVLTIIVPYLYAWYMGLYGAFEILLYRQNAKGLLYRRGLSLLSYGIVTIIISSIAVEFLNSGTRYLTQLHLNVVLLLIYLFLLIYALGYIVVAAGAKRLKRIEEI